MLLSNFSYVPSWWYIGCQLDVVALELIFAAAVTFLPFVLIPLINIHFIS